MDKKKITAIVLGTVIIIGGALVGYKVTSKNTKPTAAVKTEQKAVKATTKNANQANIPTNEIPVAQRGLNNYKEEVQDINGEKVKVMSGTYSYDPKTQYYWLGGKQISKPNYANCITPADKSITGPNLVTTEKQENVIIMMLGNRPDTNGTNIYEIIKYTGPYNEIGDFPNDPHNKYQIFAGKVVSADESGITLDDGKKYDVKNAPFIQMMNESRDSKNFLKKYDSKDFPKGTIVRIVFRNGSINTVSRYCILK